MYKIDSLFLIRILKTKTIKLLRMKKIFNKKALVEMEEIEKSESSHEVVAKLCHDTIFSVAHPRRISKFTALHLLSYHLTMTQFFFIFWPILWKSLCAFWVLSGTVFVRWRERGKKRRAKEGKSEAQSTHSTMLIA